MCPFYGRKTNKQKPLMGLLLAVLGDKLGKETMQANLGSVVWWTEDMLLLLSEVFFFFRNRENGRIFAPS